MRLYAAFSYVTELYDYLYILYGIIVNYCATLLGVSVCLYDLFTTVCVYIYTYLRDMILSYQEYRSGLSEVQGEQTHHLQIRKLINLIAPSALARLLIYKRLCFILP